MDRATMAIEAKTVKGEEGVVEFVASTNHVDRAGDIVEQNWDMKSFRKNPVFLYGHSYSDLPVGKITRVWTEKVGDKKRSEPGSRRTMIRVKFVPGDIHPFADSVRRLYEEGFLKAVSVGFRPLERGDVTSEERDALGMGQYGQRFTKSELLEVSAVTVPMNAEALSTGVQRGWYGDDETKTSEVSPRDGADVEAILRALDDIETEEVEATDVEVRGAKAPHRTAKAPEGQSWDAAAVWSSIASDYEEDERAKHYWQVASYRTDDANPDARSTYKLPHHDADGKVVLRGVMAAMAALNGGRGGVDIPDGDRRGVYDHLVAHYKQFDREPPELRALEDIESGNALLAAVERIEEAADRIEAQLEDDLQLDDNIPTDPVENQLEEDAGSLPAEEIEMDVTEEDLEEALASFGADSGLHNLESQ